MVDLDVGVEQPFDDIGMTPFGGPDQPGAVEAVKCGDVSSVGEGEFEQIEVALAGGDQVGTLLCAVLVVDVGSVVDQFSGQVEIVVPGSSNQLPVTPLLLPWFDVVPATRQ